MKERKPPNKNTKSTGQNQRKAILKEAQGAKPKRREQIYKVAFRDFQRSAELLFQLSELLLQDKYKSSDCETLEDPTDQRFCYQALIARNTIRDMISAIMLAGINRPFQEDDDVQERLFQIACRELYLAKCSGLSDLTIHLKDQEHLTICMPRDCLTGFDADTILGFEVLVCETCMDPILQEGLPQTVNRIAKCVGYDQTRDVFILEGEDGTKDYAVDVRCIQGIVIKEIHDPALVSEIQAFWKGNIAKRSSKDNLTYYS